MSSASSQPTQSSPNAKRTRPEATDGRQYIEEKGDEKIVKNSPYGAKRQAYGWGNPFAKPLKAVSAKYPSVWIGCSSLNAAPSKDRAMEQLLQQFQKKFRCLEHCAPYHRMGEVEQWEKWGAAVAGKQFTYTIKCNQYLTHMKMLEVDADTTAHIKNFFEDRIPKLGSSFGAALVQLPPMFRFTEEHLQRVKDVAALIPSTVKVAIEFRHNSWFNDRTYEVLRAIKWAMVATHTPDVGMSPIIDTGAGFMYIRLHGAVELYAGDYGLPSLRTWAEHIQRFIAANSASAPVYVFFNNNESHVGGLTSSVVDATALAECLDVLPPAETLPSTTPAAQPAPPIATAAPAASLGQETEDEVIEVDAE